MKVPLAAQDYAKTLGWRLELNHPFNIFKTKCEPAYAKI